ncbi:hypothetical protein GCM10022384_64740 [Streptomyces marokkonensis]|uniref:Secreted protein n=1 Tax=Streptomyces marokkonensis TaxID=324855 RepID=A0ABP7SE81_9ACTN
MWGGLLLAVAAVAVVEAAAGPALGDGGEDQRITVEPVEVAFERPWSWARGLDAFHMMRHRKDIGLGESQKSTGQSPTMDFPSRVQAPKASNERPQQPPIPPFGRKSSPRPAHV